MVVVEEAGIVGDESVTADDEDGLGNDLELGEERRDAQGSRDFDLATRIAQDDQHEDVEATGRVGEFL